MKKLVLFLLLAMLVLSLLACDSTNSPNSPTRPTETQMTDPANPVNPTEPNETEQPTETLKFSEGLEYMLNSDGVSYSVTGIGTCADTDIIIPCVYNDLPVTTVGTGAFERCEKLTGISISDSVTNIGSYAFSECTSLTTVKLSNNLTEISDHLFSRCINLESIKIPDGVTSIGKRAFFNCIKLNSVSIPASVKKIGSRAFGANSYMEGIALLNVYITDLSAWCKMEFCDPYMGVVVGTAFYSPYNLYCNNELLTDLVVPDDVTRIDVQTFGNCVSITSVRISDSVTSMAYDAFDDCPNLTQIYIGKGLETFEGSGYDPLVFFPNCNELTSFNVDPLNPYFSNDESGVLFNKNKTLLIRAPATLKGTYNVPSSVTEIDYIAFDGCKKLTGIVISKSLEHVRECAFYNCDMLANVYYEGAQSDWEKIEFELENDSLTNATIHYNQMHI